MRWRYHDPNNPEEAAAHANTIQAIDRWWAEFTAKADDLVALFKNQKRWDLPAWMNTYLSPISPHLMWEFGPALGGTGYRLVITPETHAHLRPLVDTLLALAPDLPPWEFYPWRPPESLDIAVRTVEGRAGGSIANTRASATVGKHNLLELHFHDPATTGPDDRQALKNAFVAAESLLGEQLLDQWIGIVDVQPLPKQGPLRKLLGRGRSAPHLLPLERLKPTVDAMIDSLREQLPREPYYPSLPDRFKTQGYALMEFKPARADDYPGFTDLITAIMPDVPLFRALHSGSFYSARYSRHGETFCYLKLDNDDLHFRERAEIAVNDLLVPASAGCSISAGVGIRYSYIDLALADLDHAISILRQANLDLPERSWLLFFDAHLATEWIGLFPSTPPPP